MKILKTAKWVNFIVGLYNVYILLYIKNSALFLMILSINLIIFYLQTRSLFHVITAVVTYPFGLLLSNFKGSLKKAAKEIKVEEGEETIDVDIMPLKSYILLGTSEEKKKAIVEYTKAVKSHRKPASEAVNMFKKLVEDPHPDVGLYASEAIEEIEVFLIDEMFRAPNDKIFCKLALEYVKSGYVYGNLEEYYKNLIRSRVETVPRTDPEYYIIKFEVTRDLNVLYEGLEKTGSIRIRDILIAEEIKRRNTKTVKNLLMQ